jgi:BirA family transcriptional regulator, biotin operon repressor / biotin---[acetyl-CoA-carboxylase] ligase
VTPGTVAPDAVRPLLRGRFGDPFLYEAECPSTQALLAGSDLPEGAVAVTEHQTAGRGRFGRTWEDAPGTALLVSVLLRPPAANANPELSLICGLAVAEAVEAATGLSAQLKWPNDVMLDRRKVAGILLEGSEGSVLCGIGVNVNQSRDQLPADTRTAAGSLRTVTGSVHDRALLLADLLALLEEHYDAWHEDGLAPLFAGIGARNFVFGRRLRLDGHAGTGGSILPDGRLEIALDSGEHLHVESGELEVDR